MTMSKTRCRSVLVLFCLGMMSLPTLAEATEKKEPPRETEARLNSLENRLQRLEERLDLLLDRLATKTDADAAQDATAIATETQAIAREIEESETPAAPIVTQGADAAPQPDSNPPDRVPYGGYMEMHLNHDNINPTTLDLHRFVLLFGHQFDERIRFVGEMEIEHALVEGGEESGELEIEQAYLDFLLFPNLSFRAGMMLTPVGIVNERHEPASFNGVERPFVDDVIIPSTWFAQGAGLVGDLGHGLSFKAFAQSSLNGAFFNAQEGFRGGRQKGFLANASHAAVVGRLEYAGLPGLNLGTSFWIGNTGFDFDLAAQARIFEFDGQYSRGRFDFRGQFAYTNMDDADKINRASQRRFGVNPNIAEAMLGYYLEGALHVLPTNARNDLVAFYRFESFDTQFRMPDGFLPLKQFDRTAHILGVTYFPHPDIAFKFDYNFLSNASPVVRIPDRWNFGIGWWF